MAGNEHLAVALEPRRWRPYCEEFFMSEMPEERTSCPKCKATGLERLAVMQRAGMYPASRTEAVERDAATRRRRVPCTPLLDLMPCQGGQDDD